MSAPPLLLGAVLGFVAASRLAEWLVTERNERRLRAAGARAPARGRDGLRAIALVHASLFVVLPLEAWLAPWARVGLHTWFVLAVALGAVAVRYWAAASLGRLYTKRVLRVPGAPLVVRGPYRWVRHPIYRAVWVELVAWPLLFAAFGSAAWLALANAWALRHRIALEERHLGLEP